MDDLASNRHHSTATSEPTRHPDLSFTDGNIAILTGQVYFLVHKGLLCRHSTPLQQMTKSLDPLIRLEGRPILALQDTPQEMALFLAALYDGVLFDSKLDSVDFAAISALLRLTTKYEVKLRSSLLRELQRVQWPVRLAQWDIREAEATHNGQYNARSRYPHPILVINLARAINAPELLPSAFYDLSRSPVSETTAGHIDSQGVLHQLAQGDLMHLLKGREHASRFLSTFIVNELEGREPSSNCLHRQFQDVGHGRVCQAAFENVTFEILRDVNGVTHRSSDPLFAMLDSELMQTRDSGQGPVMRACEFCRLEFGTAVDQAREEFWQKMAIWFGVELTGWT
ncbi:hypothetical protein MIND_00055200 [Mycena indigotica]|uniref:BTB domain-containing protein n=1 Tax=Mycena indigotica TaxID=2126181 RepID=A0A8H6TDD5_9AGAR|nr:uncharacterized protein MIND_00055200 [Mycena indigotica]KAF7315405.1 hypothetical protein MIND_00055200 [Mycena indigotica]